MYTKRQREILSLLLKNKEPITAEWIGKELGVSDRTIRTEMKELQKQSPLLGFTLTSIRSKGYLLEMKDKALFEGVFYESEKEASVLTPINLTDQNSRVIYLLKRFLLESEPIKLESLEDELFVSKPKIQSDLKIVRKFLDQYSLRLVTRPHYGTKVEGEEYRKRLCFSHYLFSRNETLTFDNSSTPLVDKKLIKLIRKIIINKVTDYKLVISDFSLENLATHLAFACMRLEEGFVMENLQEDEIAEHPVEWEVAEKIAKEIECSTKLRFPVSEIHYITVHLIGTKLIPAENKIENSRESNDEVDRIIDVMLHTLEKEMNWNFFEDTDFIQALTLHIKPAIHRLRYKMNIRNPLLKEIKVKYPSAFGAAALVSKCIERELSLKVNEHEIAYIALHIGVALERLKVKNKKVKEAILVCASGEGSAKLLYYQLKSVFKDELNIVATLNYYQLEQYDISSVDFIVSTIPIEKELGIPIHVVHTFLEEKHIKEIKGSFASSIKVEEKTFLDESRIFIHKDFQDKESVIRFMCKELYKQGLVRRDYVQIVLEREALAPTAFGNLVAIPHPLTPETTDTFWTVCTLKRPIAWYDKQMVQFICLLNIKKGPKGDLDQMYKKIVDLFADNVVVRKLINSNSAKEIMNILSLWR